MRVAFVNCTVLADYYTCNVQVLPLPTTPSYDPDVLTRLHSVIVSVVCLIGVLMVAGFVLCLVCTRGTSERMLGYSAAKDEEKSPALPGLYTVSAAHAVLNPMLFTALAPGMTEDAAAPGKDSPAYLAGQLPPPPLPSTPAVQAGIHDNDDDEDDDDDDDDDDEFFGSRTSFHSDCSLPATPATPNVLANNAIMFCGYQASRL